MKEKSNSCFICFREDFFQTFKGFHCLCEGICDKGEITALAICLLHAFSFTRVFGFSKKELSNAFPFFVISKCDGSLFLQSDETYQSGMLGNLGDVKV